MVIWSQQAMVDLRSVHDFIARDSRYYAKKVVHDIRMLVEELNGLPKMGRMVPELNEEVIRELLLYSYRIIYEIKGEEILYSLWHTREGIWKMKKFPNCCPPNLT